MKNAMQDYNLRLTFARPERGAYLANVKVLIDRAEESTAGSQMLAATATGPMRCWRPDPGRAFDRSLLTLAVAAIKLHGGESNAIEGTTRFVLSAAFIMRAGLGIEPLSATATLRVC